MTENCSEIYYWKWFWNEISFSMGSRLFHLHLQISNVHISCLDRSPVTLFKKTFCRDYVITKDIIISGYNKQRYNYARKC